MEAVISNFDEYLKAFGLTIGLFVVSGIASLVLGHHPRRPPGRPGVDPQQGGGALRHAVPQHAAADDLRLHLHRDAGAGLQLQVRRGRRDRGLQRLGLLLPRLPGAHPLHLRLRLRGDALRRQRRPPRTGRGRPRDRPHLRPVDDPRHPSPGGARGDPADDQRDDRPGQEHLRGGGLRPRRGDGHDARASPTTTPTSGSGSSSRSRSATSSSSRSSRCRPTSSSER